MLEVREHGVKVSVVMPGAVATEFNGNTPSEKDSWKLTPEDVSDAVASMVNTPPHVLLHRVEVRTNNSPPAKGGRSPR
jgi:NADP-dependent 3-hydroxy acid dehydrogenase YdfG